MKILTYASVPILVVYLGLFFYNYNASFIKNDFFESMPKLVEKVKDTEKNPVVDDILENYIIGVVSCEKPASYNIAAKKAKAVAARTIAYYKINKENFNEANLTTATDQCYIDENAMKEKWGDTYDKYKEIVASAVKATEGEIIKKNNELFKTYYFSTSNGYTEDAITVFKNNDITFTVSQAFTLDILEILNDKDKYLDEIDNIMNDSKVDAYVFVITDIIKNGSYLLYNKECEESIRKAFNLKKVSEGVFVKDVVSRKKQIVPVLIDSLEK